MSLFEKCRARYFWCSINHKRWTTLSQKNCSRGTSASFKKDVTWFLRNSSGRDYVTPFVSHDMLMDYSVQARYRIIRQMLSLVPYGGLRQ